MKQENAEKNWRDVKVDRRFLLQFYGKSCISNMKLCERIEGKKQSFEWTCGFNMKQIKKHHCYFDII